jgi:uncharacterized protein (TIGR03437 family)
MRKLFLLLSLLTSVSLDARQQKLSCGTHGGRFLEEWRLHRESENTGRLTKLKQAGIAALAGKAAADALPVLPDIGNLAILDETAGVVSRRNPFDLGGRTLRFVPVGSGQARYRYELGEDTYNQSLVESGTVLAGLGDDDTRETPLPFAFPFFGASYRSVYVNSDGNLSFTAGDAAITDRSLGRFAAGPPRIAGLFTDLDPTRARTGVVVSASAEVFAVTWAQVPEYRDSGTGPLQTFQIRLFADGRIEIAFSTVTSREVVTGITPGKNPTLLSLVSFAGDPSGEYSSTVAERFSGSEEIDIFSAAQKFYLNHEDAYDYIVIYNTLNIDALDDAVAYEVTVRNNRSGYGDPKVDGGAAAGSRRRLQAIINMGPLSQYPRDPGALVPARLSVGDTPLSTLAHEAGHLFLAYASVRDENDVENRPMLGFQGAHWDFLFNSDASLLEGNRIQDNGPAASPRFQTVAAVEGFSALDQYLMGLRPAAEVPDTFLVTSARGSITTGQPRVGASFNGTRREIRLDEIIGAEGRRTPDHLVSQRRFRFAFLLVTPAGQQPTAEQVEQVERYRQEFEGYFARVTGDRASADTTLKKAVRVSTWPAAGVTAGGTATASIEIERPAVTPLTVLLRSQSGLLGTPASVTIPAGESRAVFTIRGVRHGVDELIAEPSDTQYERVLSKIQVAAPDALRLVVSGGDGQTAAAGQPLPQAVTIRVTDENELPYPGIPLRISLTGGGSVDRAEATTDETGSISLRWTPGPGSVNELRAALPNGAAVVATALGRPAIAASAVVNAASFAPGLTPGAIATVFGASLAASGTVDVLLNGRTVPVFFSSTRQVNFYVPSDTPAGTADLLLRTSVGNSDPVRVPVSTLQPGIFFDTASGYGAILTTGTGQVTQLRPPAAGDIIEIYGTGLGAVQGSTTIASPRVMVGGVNAEVLFSGLAPGFTGLYQINARVPVVRAGTHGLVVSAGGASSNEVRIAIR